jgi:hypothetical protein
MTTPFNSQGNCSMITVKGAISAFRSACFITTWRKLTPFSRAVRMYCWVITSVIEARVIRAM